MYGSKEGDIEKLGLASVIVIEKAVVGASLRVGVPDGLSAGTESW